MTQSIHFTSLFRNFFLLLALLIWSSVSNFFTISPEHFRNNQLSNLSTNSDDFNPLLAQQSVAFCKIYDANFNCLYCIRNFYLSNNICIGLNYTSLITGCNIYASAATCYQCDNGLYLVSNATICSPGSTSSGCLTYLNQTACASCPVGWILSNTACIYQANCVQTSSTACTVCAPGFYLNSTSNCSAVTTTITNCQIYASATTCSQCIFGFALSSDLLICYSANQVNQEVDPFCADLVVNAGRFCSVCREGYYLQGGVCVQVSSLEVCFIFNPDNTVQCQVCMPGFTMTSPGGVCSVNAAIQATQIDPLGGRSSRMMIINIALFFLLMRR